MITLKVYISGPMSGLPENNFPAFHAAARTLRAAGYEVVNPAEICAEPGKPWDYYMRADLAELLKCDAIYLLKGWLGSRGARLELHIAIDLGMRVFFDPSGIGEPHAACMPGPDGYSLEERDK